MPKREAPVTSFASTLAVVGKMNLSLASGARIWRVSANPIDAGTSALTITKASVGSHFPAMSRKARTRSGSTIPDIAKPIPKIVPQASAIAALMVQDR